MSRSRGFTLIELLVVIAIVALLASVILASLNSARDKGKVAAGKQFAGGLYRAAADQALGVWDFDECSPNTIASDRSGNNANLGLASGATWSTNSPNSSGCSLIFDGTDDYAQVNTSIFNRVNGDELAVSVWIKPSRLSGQYQGMVNNRSSGALNWHLYQHTTDGSVQLHGSGQNKSTYIPTLNTWTHIAAVVDASGKYTLYANGTLVQTVTGYTYGAGAPSQLNIGVTTPGSEPYQGSIDEVRIFAKTLTASEVKELYVAGLPAHSLASDVK